MEEEKSSPQYFGDSVNVNAVFVLLYPKNRVVKIYESGLLQQWIKRWWPKRSFCGGSLVTEAKTLTVIDMQSSFYLIGIGMVAGGMALALEVIVFKLNSRCHIGTRDNAFGHKK